MSLLKNFRKRGLKDILNPTKWKIFLRSRKLKLLRKEYSEMFVPEYLEQIALRMDMSECRQCLAEGECVHCGCRSPDLFYEKDMECSGGNWFTMIPAEDWAEYSKMTGIKPNPDYVAQIKKYGKIIKFKD